MVRCGKAVISALLPLIAATPTAAQDGSEATVAKTVEGAQAFLTDFYQRYPAGGQVWGYQAGTQWNWKEAPGATFRTLDGSIVALASSGRCRSEVRLERLYKTRHDFDDPFVPFDGDPSFLTVTIDWSKVKLVRVGEQSIWKAGERIPFRHVVAVNAGDRSIRFTHHSEADANRAAFAMEFLKLECGLKAEGF